MGAAISHLNAWLVVQGIETLPLRMDRICDNTLALAKHLQAHPKVKWVKYALPGQPQHALAQKYLGGRASGILTFGLKGGREAGTRRWRQRRVGRRGRSAPPHRVHGRVSPLIACHKMFSPR